MLECSDCGTKNTTGASMCITCGSKRLRTESEALVKPTNERTEPEATNEGVIEKPPSERNIEILRLGRDDGDLALEAFSQLKSGDWEGQGGKPESLTANYLAKFLRYDDHVFIVAIKDAEPVGYLLAYELARVDRDQTMMFFYEIGVAESHRRQGVGTALIDEIKSICRERNIMKMWVQTNESNEAAMRLFQASGGTRVEEENLVQFGWTSETF